MSKTLDRLKLLAKARLVNWEWYVTKWALILALLVGWSYFWWDKGHDSCEKKHNKAAIAQVVADVNTRMPVIAQAERDAAALRQEVKAIKEKLNEETAKNDSRTDCAISDEQLRLYRKLADKTRR